MTETRHLTRFFVLQDLEASIPGSLIRRKATARRLLASLDPVDVQQLVANRIAHNIDVAVRTSVEASIERTVSTEIERRFAELQEHFESTIATLHAPNEIREDVDLTLLDAVDFAGRLGVSDQTVRNLELDGRLFSILAIGRKRGKQYPAFQLHNDIFGDPLQATLLELRDVGGAACFQFFTSSNDLLGHLTPIQVLIGHGAQAPGARQRTIELLGLSSEERLSVVLKAAETFRAVVEA